VRVFSGGPVQPEMGFVVHSADYRRPETVAVNDRLSMTSSVDICWTLAPIAGYADRLLAAESLVLIYPVWNEGFPAILKGFFDRVFIPGVSFTVGPDGAIVPNLQKLRKIAAVCT
jgi:putative NADPH-quinone reductase